MKKYNDKQLNFVNIHSVMVFLCILAVYIFSMPETVVLEDDGYFILAGYFNGVTHPPGYPLFIILSHLFTWLPFDSVAFKMHLASAAFGAMACVCLWYLIIFLTGNTYSAYMGALSLGFSKIFWSQAIISEVYTLNVLFFLILIWLALKCVNSDRKNSHYYFKWFALTYGLALSNHWPLILLSSPGFLIILWPALGTIVRRLLLYIPFLVSGLFPYIWLVWRSYVVPEISFYGPFQSLQDFWFYVSRQAYVDVDFSNTATWQDKINYLLYMFREVPAQFGLFAMVLVLAGFIRQWLIYPLSFSLGITVVFLINTLLLILVLGFDYDLFHIATFQVYPLLSYTVMAIWLATGVKLCLDYFKNIATGKGPAVILCIIFSFLIITSVLVSNLEYNYRKHDFVAHDYASFVLNSLDKDAIFYANADNIDGPVNYLNKVEKVRPDVSVYTGRSININDELVRPYKLEAHALQDKIADFIENSHRPIYYVNDFPNNYGKDRFGLYTKINKNITGKGDQLLITPLILNFIKSWSKNYNNRLIWNRMHVNLVLSDYCNLVLNIVYSDADTIDNKYIMDAEKFACSNYYGILNKIETGFAYQDINYTEIESLLLQVNQYRDQIIYKRDEARLEYLRGIYFLNTGQESKAAESFIKSYNIWPDNTNPSITMISK